MTPSIITALERAVLLARFLAEADVDAQGVDIAGSVTSAEDLAADFTAALVEARRLTGNGRPTYNALHVHARIRQAIQKAGSCSAWGRSIGVSKSYAHDVYSSIRPPSEKVLASLGLVKKSAGRDLYLEA